MNWNFYHGTIPVRCQGRNLVNYFAIKNWNPGELAHRYSDRDGIEIF